MTREHPRQWRDAAPGLVAVVAFVVVFVVALLYEMRDVHASDPLAPAAVVGALIVAGVCGLTAAGGVIMLFGTKSD